MEEESESEKSSIGFGQNEEAQDGLRNKLKGTWRTLYSQNNQLSGYVVDIDDEGNAYLAPYLKSINDENGTPRHMLSDENPEEKNMYAAIKIPHITSQNPSSRQDLENWCKAANTQVDELLNDWWYIEDSGSVIEGYVDSIQGRRIFVNPFLTSYMDENGMVNFTISDQVPKEYRRNRPASIPFTATLVKYPTSRELLEIKCEEANEKERENFSKE